ncbi:hypothetical protein CP533_4240 [Ophiocordyceps camponoti-saundersi (nom. inval.)]|nr:hypothetical protein CP533_4240 [Ophiocordyceps camponoti-saundersi (nom. inval.)]
MDTCSAAAAHNDGKDESLRLPRDAAEEADELPPSDHSSVAAPRQASSFREHEVVVSSSPTQPEAYEAAPYEEYELARSPTSKQREYPIYAEDDAEVQSSISKTPPNASEWFVADEAPVLKWPGLQQEEAASQAAEQPTWESLLHKVPRHPLAAFAVQQRAPSIQSVRRSWSISDVDHDGAQEIETPKRVAHGAGEGDDRSMPSECLMQRWLDEDIPFLSFQWDDVTRDDRCDVDVCTGKLLPETQYEETLIAQIMGPCLSAKDIAWRQTNMTSSLYISREIELRERLAHRLKACASNTAMRQSQAATSVEKAEESQFPKAHCTIRPATEKDLDRIVEILELERNREDCRQVFRADSFCAEDIRAIFRGCRRDNRPFLVATPQSTEEELMDRSKWPKQSEAVYQKYLEFVRANGEDKPQPVVGFAYLYDVNLGLGHCLETRHSAYMRVLIDPSHRRKLYGTALMDRMLLSTSALHVSLIDYRWNCPNPDKIYEHPVTWNERHFARLYIEVFCESDAMAELKWRAAMLAKFNFKEVARLRKALRLERGSMNWLDMMIWEFEAQLLDDL